jgi:hypothetical protein
LKRRALKRRPLRGKPANPKHAACQSRLSSEPAGRACSKSLPGEIEFRFIRFPRAEREFNLTSVIDLEKLL